MVLERILVKVVRERREVYLTELEGMFQITELILSKHITKLILSKHIIKLILRKTYNYTNLLDVVYKIFRRD